MITVVCGEPGSGKSLYALFLMECAVRARRPVYTNIELTDECPFGDRVARIDTDEWPVIRGQPGSPGYKCFWHYIVPRAVVVLDEANLYFDCTDHAQIGRDARQFHQQHRKFGLDLVYLVQNVPNLWVRIRRLAARFVLCEWNWRSQRWMQACRIPITLSRFLRAEFTSDNFGPHCYAGGGYFTYTEASRMFGWYRTEQILGDTSFYRSLHGEAVS